MRRRVVITGIGLLTPLGVGTRETWEGLVAGRNGVGPITRFDASGYDVRIAAEVKDFDPAPWMDRQTARRMDLFVQYALAASRMAAVDAGLEGPLDDGEADRSGVVIGSGIGGLPSIESTYDRLREKGPDKVSPFFIPGVIVNMAAGAVSIEWNLRGPNSATCTACATGTHAIGEAFRQVQSGHADLMFAGGTDSVVCALGVAGFAAMRALSARNDEPERASRPFDRGRDGFVPAEGAAVVVLEDLDHARARGARIYAELVGYGATADAGHVTQPEATGTGARRCIERALAKAGCDAGDVGYVNAHGTGTPLNDVAESRAWHAALGKYAESVPLSSTKSMTGHLMGAAGAFEALVTVLALHDGFAPPTINLDDPDPECDLHHVANVGRPIEVGLALTTSFGFGGHNACLAFAPTG